MLTTTMMMMITTISRIWPSVSSDQMSGLFEYAMPPMPYSAAAGLDRRDAARAEHSAMVTLARAIGLV